MDPEIETTILEMVSDDPNGVTTERICRFTKKTPQELGDVFEHLLDSGTLLGFAGVWMTPSGFETGKARMVEALRELHAAMPTEAAISPKVVIKAAELKWDGKPLDRILSKLVTDNTIDQFPNGISLKEFILELTPRQRALINRVVELIEKEVIDTPSPQLIAQELGIPRQAVEEILRLGIRSGELIQVSDVVFYTPKQIDLLKAQIASNAPFTSNHLRDVLQTTRKYILPLLDYLDAIGFTEKQGTQRVLL